MREIVKNKLKEIIIKNGIEVCTNAQKIEALLKDYCEGCAREISVIVAPIRFGITDEIIQLKDETITIYAQNWVNRLYNEVGIDKKLGQWSIESWLFALGKNYTVFSETGSIHTEKVKSLEIAKEKTTKPVIKDAKYYYKKGLSLGKNGNHYKAVNFFEKAISINPDDADLYFALGIAYFKIDCYEQARSNFKQAIEINPKYSNAYLFPEVKNFISEKKEQQ